VPQISTEYGRCVFAKTPAFFSEKSTMAFLERIKKQNSNDFFVGRGIYLADVRKKEARRCDIVIPENGRKGHIGIFGATRTGKTRLAENLIEHDIRMGKTVWVFDPKGDIDLLAKVIQVCMDTDRMNEFIFFSPLHLDISVKINPLAYWVMLEEVVHHIASGISGSSTTGDAEFFYKVACEVLLVVARSLQVLDVTAGKKPEFNIVRLNHFISYTDLQKLYAQLKGIAQSVGSITIDNRPVRDIIEKELLPKLMQMLSSGEEHFSKVSATLRTELSQLSLGSISQLFGDTRENIVFKRLIGNIPTVFYCMTGSLLTRDTAHVIARMILSGLQSICGQFNAEGKVFNPPVSVVVDEGSNVLYHGMDDLYNKAGGTNVQLTILTQSLADFETTLGRAYTQKILDNLNCQIFLRVNHMGTSEYAASHAGKMKVFAPILSMGGFSSAREMEQDVMPASALTRLGVREFVAFIYENAYIGKTADVSPLYLKLEMPRLKRKGPLQQSQE